MAQHENNQVSSNFIETPRNFETCEHCPNLNRIDMLSTLETSVLMLDINTALKQIWKADHDFYLLLKKANSLEEARNKMFSYLERIERHLLSLECQLYALENSAARHSLRVLKSIIAPINEKKTGCSALEILWKLARNPKDNIKKKVSTCFLIEITGLIKVLTGQSGIYENENGEIKPPEFLKLKGREAAIKRMETLDNIANQVYQCMEKYRSGLEEKVIAKRERHKKRILEYFGGTQRDWEDYKWHLRHVIREPEQLFDLIELTAEDKAAISKAVENGVPFGITPYYLSLMDLENSSREDHAIRAQVIPPQVYVDIMSDHSADREYAFDFMGEHDTSPIDLVTRRYPMIAIIKPFNTCAQICVYCQRNWEIDEVLDPHAMATKDTLQEAIDWFDDHPEVGEVLITGGDPMVMSNKRLERILEAFSQKKQIYRIRFGTRTPVVMPQRWTDELVSLLARYHQPPHREITIVTHFEHPYEITPDAMRAVQKIRKAGMSVYNQEVFTIENSRRFETVKLRRTLKSIGIDPYYSFNMKGKEETKQYMVPIARILQERKEEARLLPGIDRTDEPVFNVPRLGKNHLRARQDHLLIMIKPNGARVYEFHPWEKNLSPVPTYIYEDKPILDYLKELADRGENVEDYRTIWYYY